MLRLLALLLASSLAACRPAASQPDDWGARTSDPCATWDGDNRIRACEARTLTLDPGRVAIDAGTNGSITVTAWDGDAVELVAYVQAGAETEAEAQALVEATRIETEGTVRPVTPDLDAGRGERWVATSFVVRVPRRTDLDLRAVNGSLRVRGVEGQLRARTTNGALKFDAIAGDVRARTANGSVSVDLAGDAWRGTGLDVETTNGSVSLTVPEGYSADLSAATTMGRLRADGLAIAPTRGRWTGGAVEGAIGRGGAPVRAVTTNGSVRIRTR